MAQNQNPKGTGAEKPFRTGVAGGRSNATILTKNFGPGKPGQAKNASGKNIGNQVRVQGNTKGTGEAYRPSSQALASKRSTKPATENPDGSRNRGMNFGR